MSTGDLPWRLKGLIEQKSKICLINVNNFLLKSCNTISVKQVALFHYLFKTFFIIYIIMKIASVTLFSKILT